MGVERAVTCWYAHHQVIRLEITRLQTLLDQLQSSEEKPSPQEAAEVKHQLALAQASLLNLGPCPKPMMG